jgi:hypothetical protein
MRAHPALLLMPVLVLGCQKPSRLVGTWSATTATDPTMTATWTFKLNGTFQYRNFIKDQKDTMEVDAEGSYIDEGDKLTIENSRRSGRFPNGKREDVPFPPIETIAVGWSDPNHFSAFEAESPAPIQFVRTR